MTEVERRIETLLNELTIAFAELVHENDTLRRRLRQNQARSSLGLSRIDHRFKSMFRQAAKPELQQWLPMHQLSGHQDGILDVSTSPSHHYFAATASVDCSVIVWDVCRKVQTYIFNHHAGAVNSARFHPTLPIIITGSGDETSAIVNLAKVRHPSQTASTTSAAINHEEDVELHRSLSPVRSLSWPRLDNDTTAENDNDQSIQKKRSNSVPSLSNCRTIREADHVIRGHDGPVTCTDWVFDGSQVASGSWDGQCLIFDIGDGSATLSRRLKGHAGRISNLSTTKSSKLVLTASQDETICLWDLRQASQSVSIFRSHTAEVTSAVFSTGHHGDLIASSSEDRTVQIFDIRIVKKPLTEIACASRINRLCFSPNGSLLTLPGDDGSLYSYNISGELAIKSGKVKKTDVDMVFAASWTCDSAQLLSVGWDGNLTSWITSEPEIMVS